MPRYINKFKAPAFTEETILTRNGRVIGTIRIKPGTVLWRPRGQGQFYSVSLDSFTQWITDPNTRARRTGS